MWIKLTPVSIHAPRVGRDPRSRGSLRPRKRFNSRAPRGARPPLASGCPPVVLFQFTRPAWGATRRSCTRRSRAWFQFTRPAWGATLPARGLPRSGGFNSRAPRGARRVLPVCAPPLPVSIHAPRVGRDCRRRRAWRSRRFQFTRPAWGATWLAAAAGAAALFQFTRPAWGATAAVRCERAGVGVSIHAPRVGRDAGVHRGRPLRGVSIHAPRVGRDLCGAAGRDAGAGFNSRAPRGARLPALLAAFGGVVSIHAPRVGRDGGYCNTFSRNEKGECFRVPGGNKGDVQLSKNEALA